MLLFAQMRIEQQVIHPDDSIHRRAYLMAYIGKKPGLHFGGFPGHAESDGQLANFCPEFLLNAVAPGDIPRDSEHACGNTALAQRGGSNLQPKFRPSLACTPIS